MSITTSKKDNSETEKFKTTAIQDKPEKKTILKTKHLKKENAEKGTL